MGILEDMIKARNEKDWEEEVYKKSTLKWYRLAKDDVGVERYVRSVQGQASVRLLYRLRLVQKRCRMVSDERCVICDSIS